MASSQRSLALGNRRAARSLHALSNEFFEKRTAVGLSQEVVAAAAGMSRSTYSRIENNLVPDLSIRTAARLASVLGLDLSLRLFPGPDPVRDLAHHERLMRVLSNVSQPLSYQLEAPLPTRPVGPPEQRAWDALISGLGRRTGVELEMRLRDAQAVERRVNLKRQDDPVDGFLLLLADTETNRRALRSMPAVFGDLPRLAIGQIIRPLREGRHPPSAIVLV